MATELDAVFLATSETELSDALVKYADLVERQGIARGVPRYMADAVSRYVVNGIRGGSFLDAIMSNASVREVFARADDNNQHALQSWVRLIYNDLPAGCHGSVEQVNSWVQQGGIAGLAKKSLRNRVPTGVPAEA